MPPNSRTPSANAEATIMKDCTPFRAYDRPFSGYVELRHIEHLRVSLREDPGVVDTQSMPGLFGLNNVYCKRGHDKQEHDDQIETVGSLRPGDDVGHLSAGRSATVIPVMGSLLRGLWDTGSRPRGALSTGLGV